MVAREPLRRNRPDTPFIPHRRPITAGDWLGRRLKPLLEIVVWRFGKKEKVLEIDGEPILDAFREAVRLVPDDRISQKPAPAHHLSGKPIRYQAEGSARRGSAWRRGNCIAKPSCFRMQGRGIAATAAAVAVFQVYPAGAIRA